MTDQQLRNEQSRIVWFPSTSSSQVTARNGINELSPSVGRQQLAHKFLPSRKWRSEVAADVRERAKSPEPTIGATFFRNTPPVEIRGRCAREMHVLCVEWFEIRSGLWKIATFAHYRSYSAGLRRECESKSPILGLTS